MRAVEVQRQAVCSPALLTQGQNNTHTSADHPKASRERHQSWSVPPRGERCFCSSLLLSRTDDVFTLNGLTRRQQCRTCSHHSEMIRNTGPFTSSYVPFSKLKCRFTNIQTFRNSVQFNDCFFINRSFSQYKMPPFAFISKEKAGEEADEVENRMTCSSSITDICSAVCIVDFLLFCLSPAVNTQHISYEYHSATTVFQIFLIFLFSRSVNIQ